MDPIAAQTPTAPATPNAHLPVLAWFERQSPSIRAAVLLAAGALVSKFVPDLMPLFRLVTGAPTGQ